MVAGDGGWSPELDEAGARVPSNLRLVGPEGRLTFGAVAGHGIGDVGSAETFRDEAVTYATRIWQAAGVAELHVWPGGFHGFSGIVPQAALSREATAAQRSWLRRILAD